MLFCFHFLCVLFSPLAVNGDLSNNKKSSLLVEDFIKVDVLLVKICHKRRKVCSWLAQVLVIVKNYSSLPTVGRQITDKSPIAIISAACDISNDEAWSMSDRPAMLCEPLWYENLSTDYRLPTVGQSAVSRPTGFFRNFFSTVPQVSVTSENLTNFGFRVKLSVKERAVHVRLSPAKSDLQNLLSARLFFLFL